MIKIVTIPRALGPSWHVMLCVRPRDWFLGVRAWPSDARPVLLLRGIGPLQLRRYVTHQEANVLMQAPTAQASS